MFEKIWPVNKIYKLKDQLSMLNREIVELRKDSDFIESKYKKEILNLRNLINTDGMKLSSQILLNKEETIKYLSDIETNLNGVKSDIISYKHESYEDIWMTKFGYDNMISSLQLSEVEQRVPGNYERLKSLKDTHVGERCFVIGNGPSLNPSDLETLHNNNEFCFASKRINLIFDKTEWRPNIWAASDLDYIEAYQNEIKEIKGFPKLLCAQTIVRNNVLIDDAIYFPFIQVERKPQWFNSDIMRGVHFYGTITCKLINFAVYMGFKEIYLLGVDNTYPIRINKQGKQEYDTTAKSHFTSDYSTEKDVEKLNNNIENVEESFVYINDAYATVKWFCDQINVNIFNATRGGHLEVYPRVDFDTIQRL